MYLGIILLDHINQQGLFQLVPTAPPLPIQSPLIDTIKRLLGIVSRHITLSLCVVPYKSMMDLRVIERLKPLNQKATIDRPSGWLLQVGDHFQTERYYYSMEKRW